MVNCGKRINTIGVSSRPLHNNGPAADGTALGRAWFSFVAWHRSQLSSIRRRIATILILGWLESGLHWGWDRHRLWMLSLPQLKLVLLLTTTAVAGTGCVCTGAMKQEITGVLSAVS